MRRSGATDDEEPTLASTWQTVAATTIGDELLEWPPDLFALTETVLENSEAYRFALPPGWNGLAAGPHRPWRHD